MSKSIKGLHVDRKGYYRWQPPMKNGVRPKPIYLQTNDYIKAVAAYDQVKRNWELGAANFEGTFAEALEEYIEAQQGLVQIGKKEPATIYRSTNQLREYDQELAFLKNSDFDEDAGGQRIYKSIKLNRITKKDIEKWQQWKKTNRKLQVATTENKPVKPLSDSTIDTYGRILQAFFTWCVSDGKLNESPFTKITFPKLKRTKKVEFYTLEERDKLLQDPPSEAINFILHFGFYAGLRFEEINAMESNWIQGDLLNIEATDYFKPKDKEARKIRLHPRIQKFLESYGLKKQFMFAPDKTDWKPTSSNPYRFNPKKSFRSYVEQCGLEWKGYHALRASFATHLSQNGIQIAEIAKLLGDDIATTEKHYIGYSPSNNSVDCL